MTNSVATLYAAPEGAPVSKDYALTVDGQEAAVYGIPSRYGHPVCFSYFDIAGPVKIKVTVNFLPGGEIEGLTVHPLALGITARRDGNTFTFTVERTGSITLLVNGDYENRPLHLFVNPPDHPPPPGAIVFGPGKHVLGYDKPIRLKSGQTLYIAGGAWVEGIVRAPDAHGVRIMGRGVLSQSTVQGKHYAGGDTAPLGIVLTDCQNVIVEGIIETRAVGGWCGIALNCEGVRVRNYHVLAPVIWSSDGFNPCNSRYVLIEDSFFRTGDDCIAIKGTAGGSILSSPHIPPDTQPAVENIAVRRCVFWNDSNGVLVIGPETRAKHIRNIFYSDCDVIYRARHGADLGVFGILSLHGTEITNVRYEDIRVEHCNNQLFCFRFTEKIFSIPGDQSFPGGISGVSIRNVSVGYQAKGPRSEFSGWSADKQIRDVSIEGLRYGGEVVQNAEDMGLQCNDWVSDIRFGVSSDKE